MDRPDLDSSASFRIHSDFDDKNPSLARLGWSPLLDRERSSLSIPLRPARVVASGRGALQVLAAEGRSPAMPSGKLLHEAAEASSLPTVGDWVGLRPGAADVAVIDHVFSRRTALLRKAPGRRVEAQVLAANVDVVMIVSSFNADFNPRKLERFLSLAIEGGARPVFVLNKADLCADGRERFVDAVREIAPTTPVLVVSAIDGAGMEALSSHVSEGETMAIVGSSGVGKSTIVNRMLGGQAQREGAIRAHDDRGKHTTTGRELFVLPSGGLLVDTPGLRELSLWGGDPAGFDDVEDLARRCRFRDCAHAGEPGCAVQAATERGDLDEARLASFQKLASEGRHRAAQKDVRARAEIRRQGRLRSRITKQSPKT
jgi:ribosome biogenesis GTPase / thiamine phosphate phosphatase